MHDQVKSRTRRKIPAVNKILNALGHSDLPRPIVVDLVRRELSKIRIAGKIPAFESIVDLVRDSLTELRATRLQLVVNGTGIIIHTNFGRAPLPGEAIRALNELGSGYSNLEFDLAAGERGHRGIYVENALALLCEAESATIVNNCAAALMLIVRHFTRTKTDVVISRGELVQIGGGFRIGEIIEATGANLREVGSTNKTTVSDYSRALRRKTAMILKVHRSNFFMSGFVESPSSAEISGLARKKHIPFVEDLGGGTAVQLIVSVVSLSDSPAFRKPADPHSWGAASLRWLPSTLNAEQGLRLGAHGLQLRPALSYAGQQTLEMAPPKKLKSQKRPDNSQPF